MKKLLNLFVVFISLFCFSNVVSANSHTYRVKILDSGVNIRSDASTKSSRVTYVQKGSYYNLVEEHPKKDLDNYQKCSSDWYHIYYNGTSTGYVCGDHVKVVKSYSTDGIEPTTTCEIEMSNLGFPSSYWGGLCSLKEDHPDWDWQFVAVSTGLTWKEVVESESACGINYIYGSDANSGFFDTTCSSTSPGGYVAPNPAAIAYYMDPRNFLSERFIFQFQHLGYDTNLASFYPSGATSILTGASFYVYHTNLGNDLGVMIDNVGKDTGVNPIFTAARIRQELGSSEKLYNLYSGVYTGDENAYYGYYNFYNFGVSDTCVANYGTTYCGLNYAKKMEWNSVDAAIKGGISQIANNYVSKGQYTTYLQKFNVVPTNKNVLYNHQYQSNIVAPSSESGTTYDSYVDLGIINSKLYFYIPVYLEMQATIDNSGSGAVDDGEVAPPSTLPISTIVTSSGYRYTSKYISNITPGTEVSTLKGAIESVSGGSTVVISDANGNTVTEGNIGTGYKVSINNSETIEVLDVVIKGDTSGDGVINALDLLQIQKNILGTFNLNGAYKEAGDTSGDTQINALDLLQVQKSILGTFTIEQ